MDVITIDKVSAFIHNLLDFVETFPVLLQHFSRQIDLTNK